MAQVVNMYASALSLLAFLAMPTAGSANSKIMPTEDRVGQVLDFLEWEKCRFYKRSRPIAQSHCDTDRRWPTNITFEQMLCVDYGADIEKHPIARCVFKGQKRTYRAPLQVNLVEALKGTKAKDQKAAPQKDFYTETYGDGAIDLIYYDGDWRSKPLREITIE